MAYQCCSCNKHGLIFFLVVLSLQRLDTSVAVASAAGRWQSLQCDAGSMNSSCSSSFLYATSKGRNLSEIAAVFNATVSSTAALLRPIKRPSGVVDVLVAVPCTCEVINANISALFHDARYVVKPGDTPDTVNRETFSGLAMNFGDGYQLISGKTVTVHLPCGCSSAASKGVVVVSYAVQEEDTLTQIASLFRSTPQDILNLNPSLTNPDYVKPGTILFVPIIGSS